MDMLVIEAEGQPTVEIQIEAQPELVFQEEGIQGPPGPAPEAGDGIKVVGEVVNVDITGLTFAP
jgi:hypothetical protein